MARYQPIVRATVVDLKTDSPQEYDQFLIDTNAWYWLAYSRSQFTTRPPQDYQVRIYPSYIQESLRANSDLRWSGLSMAEMTTLIERSEYDIFCQTGHRDPAKFSIKEYRHGYPQERTSQVITEINAAWTTIETFGSCLESIVDQKAITQTIADLKLQAVDGYDSLLIHAANTANINQIITDDIDFVTVPGVIVFTANRNALSAAKSQNKLLVR
jgi:hypothetical protein